MSVMMAFVKILCFSVLFGQSLAISENSTADEREGDKTVILSRRKRFIVFPEGSSFQLVFCLTYPAIVGIGDIFLWGNTAALAFELPQDPYSPFNHRADPLHRRVDSKTIYYTDEDGRIIHKTPYKRKPLINPALAKRSVESPHKKNAEGPKLDRKGMHASHIRNYLDGEGMKESAVEFHRNSRVELYQKIEVMLQGFINDISINGFNCLAVSQESLQVVLWHRLFTNFLRFGADSRQCMLRTLCVVAQAKQAPQGAFLQELLRAIFTLPKTKDFDEDFYREYDEASQATDDCDKLYPGCDNHLSSAY